MSSPSLEDKVGSEQRCIQIREHFLGWQCRVREYIMRQGKGRPTPGICPRVILEDGSEASSALTVLLLPREPRESILQFRYMVLRTYDPQDRYNKAVQLLSSTFYQDPGDFSGVMTGLFINRSSLVHSLLASKKCLLEFIYQQQGFSLPCLIEAEPKDGEPHQFTYWHNRLFNHSISPEIEVLSFNVLWQEATADPPSP